MVGQVLLFEPGQPEVLPGHRLPGDPLLRVWGTAAEIARALNVRERTVYRWLADGVSYDLADRIAVAAGRHPCELWGEAWWQETENG